MYYLFVRVFVTWSNDDIIVTGNKKLDGSWSTFRIKCFRNNLDNWFQSCLFHLSLMVMDYYLWGHMISFLNRTPINSPQDLQNKMKKRWNTWSKIHKEWTDEQWSSVGGTDIWLDKKFATSSILCCSVVRYSFGEIARSVHSLWVSDHVSYPFFTITFTFGGGHELREFQMLALIL